MWKGQVGPPAGPGAAGESAGFGVHGQLREEGRGSQIWSPEVFESGHDYCDPQKWLFEFLSLGNRSLWTQRGHVACPVSRPRH